MTRFAKMHGIGNDFVLVDGLAQDFPPERAAEWAPSLCDRKFGVGSDGLIVAYAGRQTPLAMRMWNPDGSESEMCGNGARCFAAFARAEGLAESATVPVETGAGVLELAILPDGRVRVAMGRARLTRGEIGMTGPSDERYFDRPVEALGRTFRGTAVSMGNPHLVLPVEDVAGIDLERLGPVLERHPEFPRRVNVHFVEVTDRTRLRQRTWERGAGATLACGTGACAVAVACVVNGLSDRAVTVSLPGGELDVEYGEDGRAFMTGPAVRVFDGELPGDYAIRPARARGASPAS